MMVYELTDNSNVDNHDECWVMATNNNSWWMLVQWLLQWSLVHDP